MRCRLVFILSTQIETHLNRSVNLGPSGSAAWTLGIEVIGDSRQSGEERPRKKTSTDRSINEIPVSDRHLAQTNEETRERVDFCRQVAVEERSLFGVKRMGYTCSSLFVNSIISRSRGIDHEY